jgi:hypothetical protein
LVFWNNPAENIDSPKLVEIVSLNPLSCGYGGKGIEENS